MKSDVRSLRKRKRLQGLVLLSVVIIIVSVLWVVRDLDKMRVGQIPSFIVRYVAWN